MKKSANNISDFFLFLQEEGDFPPLQIPEKEHGNHGENPVEFGNPGGSRSSNHFQQMNNGCKKKVRRVIYSEEDEDDHNAGD